MYPCRYVDLIPWFGRPVSQLCMVTHIGVDHIYDTFGYLLTSLDQPWLSQNNVQLFAGAISNKGAALDNCWGFVDGPVRPVCRPKQDQSAVYKLPQKGACNKIPIIGYTKWIICQPFWACGR